MKDLNEKQLEAVEKLAVNACTIFLGTFIIGGLFASQGFRLTPFIAGCIIYIVLVWFILKINRRRQK